MDYFGNGGVIESSIAWTESGVALAAFGAVGALVAAVLLGFVLRELPIRESLAEAGRWLRPRPTPRPARARG